MSQAKVFHIFYTKDINKKKKTFKEGILVISVNNMAKIFDEDGLLVTSFKNKEQVQLQQQYTVNNSYLITVDKIGSLDDFNTGAIFTKKQILVLPVKKKIVKNGNDSKKDKKQDIVLLNCGLQMDKKLLQILRPHQKQGVQFMYQCVTGKRNKALSGCILADYMGLGKTLQTLALCLAMIRQKIIKKFVIVCPLTLLDVWQKQTKKWLQQKIIPLVCFGDGSETANIVKKFTDYDYETFYKNLQKISGKCDLIIFDEGHRMKNKKSKLLLKLKTFRCQKRILLTGTPIQNNLQQLYTCISIINPRMFGSQLIFKNVFQKPIIQGLAKKATIQQQMLAKQRTNQLAKQLKQFSLRRTAEVLKKFLPPKHQHQIFVQLTGLQRLWYQRILQSKKQSQQDMFRTLNYLRKLFIHPNLLKMRKINSGDIQICHEECNQQKSNKIQITLRILQTCVRNQQKCVVVSYFTETLDFIGRLLKLKNINYSKLDGRQKTEERKLAVLKFQKDLSVLLLSGKAGGTGLTLVCAVKMIMIQPDWNPSNDSQVMGRIWRQGQQKQVEIYRLITACTFQQKILQRQGLKKTLANNLIDGGEEQKDQRVDFDNIGKLFVQNKKQVLTYAEKQNELQQFKGLHKQLFEIDELEENKVSMQKDYGILFVKTISSQKFKQRPINQKQECTNEFTNLGVENFISGISGDKKAQKKKQIKEKRRDKQKKSDAQNKNRRNKNKKDESSQQQEQDQQFEQDEEQQQNNFYQEQNEIEQLQKIVLKKGKLSEKTVAQIANQKSQKQEREGQRQPEAQTQAYKQKEAYEQDEFQDQTQLQLKIGEQKKIVKQMRQQFRKEQGEREKESQQISQVLVSKRNKKSQITQLKSATSNLLKKIVKKQ